MQSSEYKIYIHSAEWADRKQQYFKLDGKRRFCSGCGSKRIIQVHHLSYIRLGHEEDRDLVSVCSNCHRYIHRFHEEHGGTLREATGRALNSLRNKHHASTSSKGKPQKKTKKKPSDPNLRIYPRKERVPSSFVPQRRRLTLEQRRQEESGLPVRSV